jgi:hypothetical protein
MADDAGRTVVLRQYAGPAWPDVPGRDQPGCTGVAGGMRLS